MPDLSKPSSSKQPLSSGVRYEYLAPAAETEQSTEASNQTTEKSSVSLADLMSQLKNM